MNPIARTPIQKLLDDSGSLSAHDLATRMTALVGAPTVSPPRVRWNLAGLAASRGEYNLAYAELGAALERGQPAFVWRDPSLDPLRAGPGRAVRFRAVVRRGGTAGQRPDATDPLARLDAIGPAAAAALARAGVRTPQQLLTAAGRAKDRKHFSDATSLDVGQLEAWAHLADVAELVVRVSGTGAGASTGSGTNRAPARSPMMTDPTRRMLFSHLAFQLTKLLRRRREEAVQEWLDIANLLYLANVRTKTDLASWARRANDLANSIIDINETEHVLEGPVDRAIIRRAVICAVKEKDRSRVEPGKPPKQAPAPPLSTGGGQQAATGPARSGERSETRPTLAAPAGAPEMAREADEASRDPS